VLASELAWDAILSSVPKLPPRPRGAGDPAGRRSARKNSRTLWIPGGGELTVGVDGGSLTAEFNGNGRIYFDAGRTYRLNAAQSGLFVVESAARDIVRFDESEGRITGLTLNPGPWAVRAVRLPAE
jgi:hypothetical protein